MSVLNGSKTGRRGGAASRLAWPLRRLRALVAIWAAKLIAAAIRRLRAGGGSALPGHVALRICPGLLTELAGGLPHGVIMVTGTNGKTTTCRMLSGLLQRQGLRVAANRAGANMRAGIAAALAQQADWRGRLRCEIAVIEADERSVPAVAAALSPRALVVTNLFRDQLDRAGEPAIILRLLRQAAGGLPTGARLVLNADDPMVADLGRDTAALASYYGLEDAPPGGERLHTPDSHMCRRCGAPYVYDRLYYAHLGHYRCAQCGDRRPEPGVSLAGVRSAGSTGYSAELRSGGNMVPLTVGFPGLYNVYNALAACAAMAALDRELGPGSMEISAELGAFGRMERVPAGDKSLLLALVKNPTGAHETVEAILQDPNTRHLLLVLNDNAADGQDVSWIWDIHLERLVAAADHLEVAVSGTRAGDLAVRLKYEGWPPDRLSVEPDIARALWSALAGVPAGGTLTVLATYTGMLEARRALQGDGLVAGFWER